MACYHPITAYQCGNGEVVFSELRRYDVRSELSLPCGQCIGCRLERSRQWAMRCLHEASLHDDNCFITLTYDDAHLPVRPSLDYSVFQRFMKRLRKDRPSTRFYMCGEYGSINWRPHYHACLFNCDFADKELFTTRDGIDLFISDTLSGLWPYGFASVGAVTFESAAYVARYCIKKINGDLAQFHYARSDAAGRYLLVPEFCHMSLKPGIGSGWLSKWHDDVFPHDYVVVNGHKSKPPRYYDRLLGRSDPEVLEQIKCTRTLQGRSHYADNTDRRLQDREVVQAARAALLVRSEI